MARFNVGEAFLQVTASVANIHKTIAAEVAKIKDIQIDVTPNMERFAETVAAESARLGGIEVDVTPNVAGFRQKVAAATAGISDATVNVKPDTTGFKEKVKAEVRGIGSMDVPITVDTTRANAQVGAFATELRAKLTAATTALGDIHMTADSSDVDRKIAAIRAQLVTLTNQKIGVDIDSAAASAKIKTLEAELTALGAKSPNIQVKVDVAKATAELAAFRAVVKGTGDDGNVASKLLGGLVSAIGSGISSMGSLVGSASGVGSALTSMGSSVTGAAGSFAGLGQNIGSALSSALPFLATAAQWTAMGIAIAGAGAIAVGGIGQIGGAAIALASGIVPLVTSLGLLPGLLAPIGIGLGTLALGFSNTGKSGIEFKNTMDQLKTAFDPVVNAIRSQMQPAVQSFIQAISGLAPVIQKVLPQITSAVSQVTNSFSQMFKSSSFKSDLTTLLSGAATNIKTFGDAAKNAFQGFMNIMVAAEPAVTRIATDIDQAAQKFNAWTAAARQSGELTTIFQQAATVLEQLGNTVVNIAGLFKDLWDSANRTGAFTATLDAINTGITQFRDYVTQAGGAWDQLMSKAGSVTQSLVGLVGSIGNAFVTLGNSIDISGVIDTITAAINNMTPAFAQIGSAATPVFENIITIIGRMVQALGPSVSEAFNSLGDAIKSIDWESVTVGVATFIKGMSDIVSTITTVGQAFQTFEQMINQLESGDFAGAGQSLDHLGQLWADLGTKLTDTSSIEAARTSVAGLNDTIKGVPDTHGTTFTGDPSGVQGAAGAAQGFIVGVSGDWDTKFTADPSNLIAGASSAGTAVGEIPKLSTTNMTADPSNLVAGAGQAATAIETVAPVHPTVFTGDASGIAAGAGQANSAIGSVPTNPPPTMFTGDAGSLAGAAGQASSSVASVPSDHATTLTGDASSLVAGAGQATTAIGAVPADHSTTITGDPSNLVAGAGTATTSIGGIPADHSTSIDAQDNSTSVIGNIISALSSIPTFIQTVVQTVYQSVGGAGGMIATPMAAGGIVGMARGGSLSPNMSGGVAKIIPPNTWRVIGDRLTGDESFIPINNSVASETILGVTANRMGYALAPMHSGGINSRDGRAWDWLEDLLRRYHHGHRGGTGGGGGIPVPPQMVETPLIGSGLHNVNNTAAFAGGSASISRLMNSAYDVGSMRLSPVPTVAPAPSGGGGQGGPPVVNFHINTGNSGLDSWLAETLRRYVRVQGAGDVQRALGGR